MELEFSNMRLTNSLVTIALNKSSASPSDPYQLKSVDGLGPVLVDLALADGVAAGMTEQDREIVARLEFNPDWAANQTVAQLRAGLYAVMEEETRLELLDDADVVLAYATGYVGKVEVVPFQKEPLGQVTLSCVDSPYLLAPAATALPGLAKAAFDIDNEGSTKTGFYMEVAFNGATADWTLTNTTTGEFMHFDRNFVAGETLIINTREGEKGVYLDNGVTTSDVIYALSDDSDWIQLKIGTNNFTTLSQNFDWGDVSYVKQWRGI